jgi:hypothetical protein
VARVQTIATGPPPALQPTRLSPWLIAAGVLFVSAFALMGVTLPYLSKGFTLLNALYLFMIFAALLLAVISLVDQSRQEERQRRAAAQSPASIAVGEELAHHWGWTIFVGTAAVCVATFAVLTAASFAIRMPLDLYSGLVGVFCGGFAALGVVIYLCVVVPRAAWFALSKRAGSLQGPTNRDRKQRSDGVAGETDERIRPAPDQVQG